MTHIELPLADNEHHITLLHFPRRLTAEEGAAMVEGMEALGKVFGPYMADMYFGEKTFFGPPRKPVVAMRVETGTDALAELRRRLLVGARSRGIPVSQDYGPDWQPHVTDPVFHWQPWEPIRYKRELTLIQQPHVIPVPFPDCELP